MMRYGILIALAALLSLGLFVVAGNDAIAQDRTGEHCSNGIDDNGNGRIDCEDGRCLNVGICMRVAESCANGLDDDGDGDVDCADSDCQTRGVCLPRVETCANGLDEDGDGDVDCADEDCQDTHVCTPDAEQCQNGQDDDGDGDTDCADEDCADTHVCTECPVELLNMPGQDRGDTLRLDRDAMQRRSGLTIGSGGRTAPSVVGTGGSVLFRVPVTLDGLDERADGYKVTCTIRDGGRQIGAGTHTGSYGGDLVMTELVELEADLVFGVNQPPEGARWTCILQICVGSDCRNATVTGDNAWRLDGNPQDSRRAAQGRF